MTLIIVAALCFFGLIGFLMYKKKLIGPFFRFLVSRLFLINFFLALIVAVSIPYFTLGYLESYTNNDSEDYKKYYISVPDFRGIHLDDIPEFIKGKELEYVISDSVYSDDSPAGTVIRQDPDPHTDSIESFVKPGRRIYLTIVKKEGEYKEVPDLLTVNNSKKLATVKLEMLGFKVDFEVKEHKDDGKVLDVKYKGKSIAPGTKLLKGSLITIVYGSGAGGHPVALPKLAGMTVMDANQLLALSGLESEVIYQNAMNAQDSLNFVVYKQSPHPNSVVQGVVPSGTVVSVWAKKQEIQVPVDTSGVAPAMNP